MSVRYICQECGYEGEDLIEDHIDFVLCSECGALAAEQR